MPIDWDNLTPSQEVAASKAILLMQQERMFMLTANHPPRTDFPYRRAFHRNIIMHPSGPFQSDWGTITRWYSGSAVNTVDLLREDLFLSYHIPCVTEHLFGGLRLWDGTIEIEDPSSTSQGRIYNQVRASTLPANVLPTDANIWSKTPTIKSLAWLKHIKDRIATKMDTVLYNFEQPLGFNGDGCTWAFDDAVRIETYHRYATNEAPPYNVSWGDLSKPQYNSNTVGSWYDAGVPGLILNPFFSARSQTNGSGIFQKEAYWTIVRNFPLHRPGKTKTVEIWAEGDSNNNYAFGLSGTPATSGWWKVSTLTTTDSKIDLVFGNPDWVTELETAPDSTIRRLSGGRVVKIKHEGFTEV